MLLMTANSLHGFRKKTFCEQYFTLIILFFIAKNTQRSTFLCVSAQQLANFNNKTAITRIIGRNAPDIMISLFLILNSSLEDVHADVLFLWSRVIHSFGLVKVDTRRFWNSEPFVTRMTKVHLDDQANVWLTRKLTMHLTSVSVITSGLVPDSLGQPKIMRFTVYFPQVSTVCRTLHSPELVIKWLE